MEKEEREVKLLRSWNKFANLMVEAGEAWKEHQETMLGFSSGEIETFSPALQRFVSKNFNKSRFDVMLPRLVDYWRSIGGVGELLVALPIEEAIKVMEGTRPATPEERVEAAGVILDNVGEKKRKGGKE